MVLGITDGTKCLAVLRENELATACITGPCLTQFTQFRADLAIAGTIELEAFDSMMDINFKAMFFTITEVFPIMKANGGGKIVNLSSVAGVIGVPQRGIYCASKAAVIMLTRTLALELAPHKININSVAPGNTETPMNESIRTDSAYAESLAYMEQVTPSPRTYTPPTEMAECVAFLASDAANAMYGSTMLVDEGVSAGL